VIGGTLRFVETPEAVVSGRAGSIRGGATAAVVNGVDSVGAGAGPMG